ncbi:MAG: ATP-grasp domain-containing protein [Candidatus Thorarchaeota archaeon]
MRAFIYEHISGGGLAEERWDPSFAAQGFAMLSSLSRCFDRAGHEVTITYDSRISELLLPHTSRRERVSGESDWPQVVRALSEDADVGVVIAPEDEGILTNVLSKIRSHGLDVVGPETETAALCSDKMKCSELYSELSISSPMTVSSDVGRILDKSSEVSFPAVLKPALSSGATYTSLVSDEKELGRVVERLEAKLCSSRVVLQEFVDGVDASLSLLVNNGQMRRLSVNRQYVTLGGTDSTSGYHGGECPLTHSAGEVAVSLAQRIVEALPGLRGYVGIDFVFNGKKAIPMDINSRLTVSAVGIERTHGPHALADILKCTNGFLPEASSGEGFALFKEYQGIPKSTHTPELDGKYASIMTFPGVASPPIPLPGMDGTVRPYVCGWGVSRDKARDDLVALERRIDQKLGGV